MLFNNSIYTALSSSTPASFEVDAKNMCMIFRMTTIVILIHIIPLVSANLGSSERVDPERENASSSRIRDQWNLFSEDLTAEQFPSDDDRRYIFRESGNTNKREKVTDHDGNFDDFLIPIKKEMFFVDNDEQFEAPINIDVGSSENEYIMTLNNIPVDDIFERELLIETDSEDVIHFQADHMILYGGGHDNNLSSSDKKYNKDTQKPNVKKKNDNGEKNKKKSKNKNEKNNKTKKKNRIYRNVCLDPPDPYRTCYQRFIDPENDLECDKVARKQYNYGAWLFERGKKYTPPDPPSKSKTYVPPSPPLEPYTPPFLNNDEELINGVMHLALILKDEKRINCDRMVGVEEALLKFLKDNVGSEDTFTPVCVFNDEHARDSQKVKNNSDKEVISTALQFEILFAFKKKFKRQLGRDSRKQNQMADFDNQPGLQEQNVRGGRKKEKCTASAFGLCCSQKTINAPDIDEEFCSAIECDWDKCSFSDVSEPSITPTLFPTLLPTFFPTMTPITSLTDFPTTFTASPSSRPTPKPTPGSLPCRGERKESCCNQVSINLDRSSRRFCRSLGCRSRDIQTCPSGQNPPNPSDDTCSERQMKSCCEEIAQDPSKQTKKFCRSLGCNFRECPELNSSNVEVPRSRSNGRSLESQILNPPTPRELRPTNNCRDDAHTDKEFNRVIKNYTKLRPKTTRALLDVASTASVASCNANRYSTERFGVPSLTCKQYERDDCANNEDLIFEPDDTLCF